MGKSSTDFYSVPGFGTEFVQNFGLYQAGTELLSVPILYQVHKYKESKKRSRYIVYSINYAA